MKVTRPGLALAAVFPAVMVAILLPVLQRAGTSDFATGSVVGVFIGIALLLIVVSRGPRPAGRC